MIETKLKGVFLIEPEKIADERGFFARTWDKEIFEKNGLNSKLVQCNVSFNKIKGTLRGMHYQIAPYEETKIVCCTQGEIFDVIVDLRSDSHTFRECFSIELDANMHKMLYIPEGFAHGFQTLQDDTEVFYQMSEFYKSGYSRGLRYDDPKLKIRWPLKVTAISKKDLSYEFLES